MSSLWVSGFKNVKTSRKHILILVCPSTFTKFIVETIEGNVSFWNSSKLLLYFSATEHPLDNFQIHQMENFRTNSQYASRQTIHAISMNDNDYMNRNFKLISENSRDKGRCM